MVLYSKHKRSASDNGCVSCLSSWSEAAMQYFSITALSFHEWMKMLTFGFPFCNFDLKMWNLVIKIIRSNILSVCTFWSRPNRIKGIFSSTCRSLLISALTDQKGWTAGHSQNKWSNVFFMAANNIPLVKVCAKSWTETIWVVYLLLFESVYRIFSPSSTQQKADSICTHFWAFDYIHLELSTLLLSPVSK